MTHVYYPPFFFYSINFFKDVREEIIRVRLIVDGRGDHVGCCFVEMATANAAKKVLIVIYSNMMKCIQVV